MHILAQLDLALYIVLFTIGAVCGVLVRLDQWVHGGVHHPKNDSGELDLNRSFWSYILIIMMSGLSGVMVPIGSTYIMGQLKIEILMFISAMSGSIGRFVFYKLIDWVQVKLDDALDTKKSYRSDNANNFKRRK